MTGPIEDLEVTETQVLSIYELEARADRLRRLELLARERGDISLADALAQTPALETLRRVARAEMVTVPDSDEGGL